MSTDTTFEKGDKVRFLDSPAIGEFLRGKVGEVKSMRRGRTNLCETLLNAFETYTCLRTSL